MKANDLLDMIGDVEDNIIVEAKESRKKIKTKWGLAIAASFCVIVGSITAVAATGFGTKIIALFPASETESENKASGYELSVAIEKIREEDLSEELQNVGNIIKQQFIDYSSWSSWHPSAWQKEFELRNQACDYVGLKRVKRLDCDWKEQTTILDVTGTEEGKILDVTIETDYDFDNVNVQLFTKIFTQNIDDEITIGNSYSYDAVIKESYFTTDANIKCHVVETSAGELGYQNIEGSIVDNGVWYWINIAYMEKDSNKAVELLHQWAEMF